MRYLIASFASGWLAAQIFLAGLLMLDVGGLGSLVSVAADPLLPIVMLSSGLGALIGVAATATALASGPLEEGRGGGSRATELSWARDRGGAER